MYPKKDTNTVLNLLIVEDQNIVSDLLKTQLSNYSIKCEQAQTRASALDACKQSNFNIILLDIKLDVKLSIEDIQQFLDSAHPAKVILFTSSEDEVFIQACLQKGVHGIIPKSFSVKSLVSTIKLIESGQRFIPLQHQEPTAQLIANDQISLTLIEQRVLEKLSVGCTNIEIAECLKLSDSVTKSYVRRLCQKLGARNRTQAALIALNRGLIRRAEI